jgi:NADP-dependent 3-hydroxy acid dehydrogenase YdfG
MIQEAQHTRQFDAGVRDVRDKVVLLSGGTTGIGRAIAVLLAREGAKVMTFGRTQEDLEDALQEMRGAGGDCHGITADQAKPEDVKRVFRELNDRFGGIDILINNAADSADSVTEADEQEWRYVVEANLMGYMQCCYEAVPLLKQRGGGQIVNIGSMSAKLREEGSDVYVATKSGIRGFTDSLAKTVADDGINVTLIEPGLVQSDLSDMDDAKEREKIEKKEMILPEDIARCVLYCLTQPERLNVALVHIRPIMQKI